MNNNSQNHHRKSIGLKEYNYSNPSWYYITGARLPVPLAGCIAPTDKISRFGKPGVGSLSTIIGSFKSAVSKHINKTIRSKKKSIWQRNFYEHIIRNELDLFHTRSYIEINPLKWELDEYYNTL
jgi:hypothetical protein